ncbi:MAG: sulfatase [Pseudomonadota bacterium]|nr:sulfatase [Pseudomonadota bacterium]
MLLPLLACAPPKPDVVLVSLDTTRADALDAETTPNLWALAARGARFTQAYAHAPTTLSSHASVWTGLDPHGHRVPRNGYPLAAATPVLPERLAAAGYDTIGIIGASALARPMGMDRGFGTWDEQLSRKHVKRHEARAADVTDRALAHLEERRSRTPVFLFVHYYDAHAPYDAPAPWTTRWSDPAYAGPFDGSRAAMTALADASRAGTAAAADIAEARARYRGEVAYLDAELGRLLATLHDPYVVVFGDHGEALGDVEERAWGHGPDIDAPATHVPLLVAGPGVPARVIDTPVALSDVATTVLALAGGAGRLGQGRDLAPLWKDGEGWLDGSIYLEATQPHEVEATTTWNNLAMERGVVRGPWMLLRAPWLDQGPTLRPLPVGGSGVSDVSDVSPVSGAASRAVPPGFQDALAAELSAWDAAAPPWRSVSMSDDTTEGLKALGYLEE